ncbi:MAG: sugar phosphate nucleotidyltransferase [Patescibacteria group bacterium]|nr:sugar phosphate nucleotidyltransferase [Patescibacteria group bacterium]
MKGIILAGGLATRLRPLTYVTNKHLLPIYDKPMIYYPIQAMKKAGITDVLISTSPDHAGDFAELLKDGSEFGLKFYYSIQSNPKGGIANAIGLAENYARGEKILVILGDNIFGFNLKDDVEEFKKKKGGALIYGVRITEGDLRQYGIIEIDEKNNVISIEEKPETPKSNIVQIGIYMYDERVFDFIKKLKPSKRGELEITDLNNLYLKEGQLSCKIIDWWIDAGTSHDELLRANNLVYEKIKNYQL